MEKTEEYIGQSNILMVITMLKMSLIRTQCVFSDITQNIQYHLVKRALDMVYNNVQIGMTWGDELIHEFQDVSMEFRKLISVLEG